MTITDVYILREYKEYVAETVEFGQVRINIYYTIGLVTVERCEATLIAVSRDNEAEALNTLFKQLNSANRLKKWS